MRGSAGVPPRGQSEVLGVVLLVGIVLTVSTTVVLAGGAVLEQSQTRASVDSASTSMAEFDREVQQLGTGPSPRAQASIQGLSNEGDVRVVEEGNMTVVVEQGSNTTRINRSLGKLVFEREGHEVAYQGGGVWRKAPHSNASFMVSPPEFDYRYRNVSSPTLTLPVVSLSGNVSGDDVTLSSPEGGASPPPNGAMAKRFGDGDEVTITVESDYYRAWADYFREQTQARIAVDDADQTVSLTLYGRSEPEDADEGIGAFSSGSVTTWSNSASIDSYNSSIGGYPSSAGEDATFQVDDDLTLQNSPTIDGNVVASGNLTITNGPLVNGALVTGGTPGDGSPDLIDGGDNPRVTGLFSTKNDVNFDPNTNIVLEDDLVVGGSITEFDPEEVEGDIHVHGNASLIGQHDTEVHGDIIGRQNVTVGENVSFEGSNQSIIAGNDIYVESGAIHASDDVDIIAGGDVYVEDGNAIRGEVTARDTIDGGTGPPPVFRGSVNDHSGSSPPLHLLENPRDVEIDIPGPVNDEIRAVGDSLRTSNDNTGRISDIETSDGCDPTDCSLSSGEYYLDRLMISPDETLELDTTSGNITLYVENDINLKGDVSVQGEGTVKVYVGGNSGHEDLYVEGNAAEVSVPDDDAGQFRVYMRADAHAAVGGGGDPEFTGVIYGPGPDGGEGTTFRVDNEAEIHGGIVGNLDSFSEDAEIHFDTSLASGSGRDPSFGPGPAPDGGTVRNFEFSTQNVTVGS